MGTEVHRASPSKGRSERAAIGSGASAQQIQGNAVGLGQAACVILGPSGSGKSSLSLGVIQAGGSLIGDDRIWLAPSLYGVLVWPVAELAGVIEVRGWRPVYLSWRGPLPVKFGVQIHGPETAVPRWPEAESANNSMILTGIRVPVMALPAIPGDAAVARLITALRAARPKTGQFAEALR